MTSLPFAAMVALVVGAGALLLGRRESVRVGVVAAALGLTVALLFVLLPRVPETMHRTDALGLALLAAAVTGGVLRAVLEVAAGERGRWLVAVPLLGALATLSHAVAPTLLLTGPSPRLAVVGVTLGTEQQTRDLMLPLTQSVAEWVPWAWVVVAIVAAALLVRAFKGATLAAALGWMGVAAGIFASHPAVAPSSEAAALLARAALRPGEKVIAVQPVPTGSFAMEPGFAVALLLLAAAGCAVAVLSAPAAAPQPPRGEPAARGLALSLIAFAALSTAHDALGLPLPSVVGGAGLFAVCALGFATILFGTEAAARAAARLLLASLLVSPWLLWGMLGAAP